MNKGFSFFRIIPAFLFFSFLAMAGNAKTNYIGAWYMASAGSRSPLAAAIFQPLPSAPSSGVYRMELDREQLATLRSDIPPLLSLTIPYGTQSFTLQLAEVNVAAAGMVLQTDKGRTIYQQGLHYRGIVNNNPSHIASISIFDGEVMGFFSTQNGNFIIGKMSDGSGDHCVYNDHILPPIPDFSCSAIDPPASNIPTPKYKTTGIGCKTVNIYFECDYAMYQNKGSNVTNVANYVTGLFNQVSTLYANENISVQISDIFVWTTTDPYASLTSSTAILSSFRTTRGTNFNGDLAHFLTTRSVGGGTAYGEVMCFKSYAHGVSGIYSTYSNVPTYSWTIEVVTHELGHQIGSPHTHWCGWAGGPIDNCYTPEGGSCPSGPAPVNGGTIMSYCHLTGSGINFSNGFGTQPGDRLRDKVLNASCITSSGTGTAPAGLSAANITSSSAQLSWVAVTGAVQYIVQYKPATATAWTTAGTTANTSLVISGLTANTNYLWHVSSDCSAPSADAAFTTPSGTNTSCPTPGQLSTTGVSQTGVSLSWATVTGAVNYTLELKVSGSSAWTTLGNFTSTSVTIAGLAAATSYDWHVKANCSPYSTTASFTTSSIQSTGPGCVAPPGLTTTNIASTSATLSWTAVIGATGYQLKYRKGNAKNWTIVSNVTGTSYTLTGLNKNSNYEWMVCAKCGATTTSPFSASVSFSTPANMPAPNEEVITIYPNPAKDLLYIDIDGGQSNTAGTGYLYNIQGAKIRSFQLMPGHNSISLDAMATGTYMLYIQTDAGEVMIRKIVKE